MRRTTYSAFLSLIAAFILAASGTALAQSFDYEEAPVFDFQLLRSTLDIRLNPEEGTFSGSVRHQLRANIPGADTLHLNAEGLQVDSVRSASRSLPFKQANGMLNISLADSAALDAEYTFTVYYRGQTGFGLMQNSEGTLWSSTMPRASRHWWPVIDHPRMRTRPSITLTVPASYAALATGEQRSYSEQGSQKTVTFESSHPVAVPEIAIVAGQFQQQKVAESPVPITINSRAGVDINTDSLAQQAPSLITQMQQRIGQQFPFSALNIVVLNDHFWQQKSYAAGTIFVFANRSNPTEQLRRGIIAQWLGAQIPPVQWAQAAPLLATQALFRGDVKPVPVVTENEHSIAHSSLYDAFSYTHWNRWQQWVADQPEAVQHLYTKVGSAMAEQSPQTITPRTFADYWYQITGQPNFSAPVIAADESNITDEPTMADSVKYRVDYLLNAAGTELQLVFDVQQSLLTQSTPLALIKQRNATADSTNITFSGRQDTVRVSVDSGVRNVYLQNIPAGRKLGLDERKPVPYILYQLRNGQTAALKQEAAAQLGQHSDNPDLQLALNDVMQQQMEPGVEAALLRSYAQITNGANGTQQRFLDALRSDYQTVRAAALQALSRYDDAQINDRLGDYIQREASPQLATQAMNMYLSKLDSTAAMEYTNKTVQQDTAGVRAIAAIDFMAENGSQEQAITLAEYYTEAVYSYPVRQQALDILFEHADAVDDWNQRANMLLGDVDPRIRFLMARQLGNVPGIDGAALRQEYRTNEDDARVFKALGE